MSSNGRLVVPASIQKALDLKDGVAVSMTVKGTELVMENAIIRARRARDHLLHVMTDNGRSMVDDLMEERRAAAAKGD